MTAGGDLEKACVAFGDWTGNPLLTYETEAIQCRG